MLSPCVGLHVAQSSKTRWVACSAVQVKLVSYRRGQPPQPLSCAPAGGSGCGAVGPLLRASPILGRWGDAGPLADHQAPVDVNCVAVSDCAGDPKMPDAELMIFQNGVQHPHGRWTDGTLETVTVRLGYRSISLGETGDRGP